MAIQDIASHSPPPASPPRRRSESLNPATGEVWRSYEPATPDDVCRAVARAREAQRAWAARPVRERARALERFRRALYRRRLEVADVISRENGKPAGEALGTEVSVVLDYARFYARQAPRALGAGSWFTPGSLSMLRKRVRIGHEPYGVVAVVSPWNYPFMLAGGVVLPALVAGNAVLLKPSEFTPTSGVLLHELVEEAGVPPGVMQTLPGDGATGAALVGAEVDKVFFTGSVATGRRVAVACAERLIPCSLELGGSDPAIVLEDADVPHAAAGIAWGRFSNAGQTCVAPKRVFVVDAVYDAFTAELRRVVEGLRVAPAGAAGDVGPLIRPSQAEELRAQLRDATERGARVLARGALAADAADEGGWVAPTVLEHVTAEMRVMREETFGPLLPVMRVRDADEAVRLANASEFGLSASVWGRDRRRALAVAERIEAGSVAINDSIIVAGMADVPHGGMKSSGSGRSHGIAGLMECVRTKTVVADTVPGLRQPWWFGYDADHPANIDAAVRLAHATGWAERLRGVGRVVRMVLRR